LAETATRDAWAADVASLVLREESPVKSQPLSDLRPGEVTWVSHLPKTPGNGVVVHERFESPPSA
jgi:hypothetical protein